jgi:hypothetical protein
VFSEFDGRASFEKIALKREPLRSILGQGEESGMKNWTLAAALVALLVFSPQLFAQQGRAATSGGTAAKEGGNDPHDLN